VGTLALCFLHYVRSNRVFVQNNGTCSQLSFRLRPSETFESTPLRMKKGRKCEIVPVLNKDITGNGGMAPPIINVGTR
jgi:hypothetical protein